MRKIAGLVLLIVVFTGLFVMTAIEVGAFQAVIIWSVACGTAAVIVFAIALIHSD